MNSYVIKIIHPAAGPPSLHDGEYLKSYDPDANMGRGEIETTAEKSEALPFEDAAAAFAFWQQQSFMQPYRPDGKPNRPLTAFTIEVEPMQARCDFCPQGDPVVRYPAKDCQTGPVTRSRGDWQACARCAGFIDSLRLSELVPIVTEEFLASGKLGENARSWITAQITYGYEQFLKHRTTA